MLHRPGGRSPERARAGGDRGRPRNRRVAGTDNARRTDRCASVAEAAPVARQLRAGPRCRHGCRPPPRRLPGSRRVGHEPRTVPHFGGTRAAARTARGARRGRSHVVPDSRQFGRGPIVRGTSSGGEDGLRAHGGERRARRSDLCAAGGSPARARACRRAAADVFTAGAPVAARWSTWFPWERRQGPACSATDAPGSHRVELRAPGPRREGAGPPPRRFRRRLHACGGRERLWQRRFWGRDRGVGGAARPEPYPPRRAP